MKISRLLFINFISLFFIQIVIVDAFATASLIQISPLDETIDISSAIDIYLGEGEYFQISTPSTDGIVRRIEVRADSEHPTGHWAVFTITNSSNKQIDRLIVAPHYRLVRSGIFFPDLDSVRIHSITPSEGFSLERQNSTDSDIFSFTINPGSVITFIAELGSSTLPQLSLFNPDTYKDTVNAYTLYHGILLGIASFLVLLLTTLFILKGTSLFSITAIFAWSVLIYLCIDFYCFSNMFTIATNYIPSLRSATEIALSTSFVMFLLFYLNLNKWHLNFNYGILFFLCIVAFFDPTHIASIARISFGLTTVFGILVISFFSFRGYDKAIMLIPTWILFIFWFTGAVAAITGFIDNNDIVQPALASGLVLIVLLMSFTVMQNALSSDNHGLFSASEKQSFAVIGITDHLVWNWDIINDRVYTNPNLSFYLGSSAKYLHDSLRNWFPVMHTEDRNSFQLALDALLKNRIKKIIKTFRLRANDGQYHWFSLHACSVRGNNGEIVRCIGMMTDVTQSKKTEERLFYNSIYDGLTGLPNKQLLLDRLKTYCNLFAEGIHINPALLVIDFDNFRSINQHYGLSVGDAFLITVARRLSRHLKPLDTLCRLSADRFAFLLISQKNLGQIAAFTISLQKTLSLPIIFAKKEIKISTSIGILPWTGANIKAENRLNDATLAMYYAKYQGGNRIEPFQPVFRSLMKEKLFMKDELYHALTNKEFEVIYSPVFDISDGIIIGLEAKLRWNHPAHTSLFLHDFIHAAENANLGLPIINYIISHALADTASINEYFPKKELFISIDIPSSYFIRYELLNSFQSSLVRTPLKKGQLYVEASQSVLMQNPELTVLLLQRLKAFGIGLILNNFGVEHSSFDCFTRFPLTMIKMERTIFQGKLPHKILKSLIAMAHDLNFKVIACDVESIDATRFFKEFRCDYFQSETFCEPIPISRIISILKKYQMT